MAILCLARDLNDLQVRLGKIIIAYTRGRTPVSARDLKADGAMAVLLKEAIKPNLVQTIEGTPALIHGRPFANIAHGCEAHVCTHWADGGAGAESLAHAVAALAEKDAGQFAPLYDNDLLLFAKINTVATRIYRAEEAVAEPSVHAQLARWEAAGYGDLPVCPEFRRQRRLALARMARSSDYPNPRTRRSDFFVAVQRETQEHPVK